jgi:homogentisate 1,2-dioxygenase
MSDHSSLPNDDRNGYLEDWTRDGFTGERAMIRRSHYTPEFLSARGPHAPRRLNVGRVEITDPDGFGMPVVVAKARTGLRLGVSRRNESMRYVMRNVECDEIHFVQEGALRFRTGYGTIPANAGDFVCIPRSIAYQVELLGSSALTMVVESPLALRLRPQEGPQAVDHLRDIFYPQLDEPGPSRGETTLVLKSGDDLTEFVLPDDPLRAIARAGGVNPVWKIALASIPPKSEGSPVPFLGTNGNEMLLFTLCASPRTRRPPIHVNADFDEVIFYSAGPGAWGGVDEPGTLTWVPKGVTHNGPTENVPAGYQAWLLESRATLRLTPAGLAVAELMETGLYGRHRAVSAAGRP